MPTLTIEQLHRIGMAIFTNAGVTEEESAHVMNLLLESNLVGHDSHGISRIPAYISQILAGKTTLGTPITIVRETSTIALVDGNWGLGQVVATKTMNLAIKKARMNDVGIVCTFNCQHIGRMADYALMAAEQDMIGYCCVNSTPGVAPFGGIQRMFNQSPLGWAFPTKEESPFVLDISTSVCAGGKIAVAKARKELLPPGCIIDKDGNPSIDPEAFYQGGAGLPLGGRVGYKGFGLAMIVDVTAGLLSSRGAAYLDGEKGQGIFQMAIKIDAFRPIDDFKKDMDQLIRAVKKSKTAPGVQEILIPGEPERRIKADRLKNGVDIPQTTWQELITTGKKVNVDIEAF